MLKYQCEIIPSVVSQGRSQEFDMGGYC